MDMNYKLNETSPVALKNYHTSSCLAFSFIKHGLQIRIRVDLQGYKCHEFHSHAQASNTISLNS